MKFLLAIVLTAACAAPPAYVNVAHVRDNIGDVISHDSSNRRTITSMGHTTNATATVFTRSDAGSRHEESWVHNSNGWTLANTKDAMR
ncbi:MAG TPA: hypothetical protein VGG74_22070 [Kofleriaceae bacterium]|jgi:hypothetical protein